MRKQKIYFKYWLGFLCLPAALILELLAQHCAGFAEGYADSVYRVLSQGINMLTRIFPFSVMEVFCCSLILAGCWFIICLLRCLFRRDEWKNKLRWIGKRLSHIGQFFSILVLAFVMLCGINYYRDDFAAQSGLQIKPSSVEELVEVCEDLTERAVHLSTELEHFDEENVCVLNSSGNRQLSAQVDKAYGKVEGLYPMLGGNYRNAKYMFGSFFMSRLELTGVFFPFSMEGNVNKLAPSFNLPFTAAHEMAHLRGFMREDEANYIAWVVCSHSDSIELQYSGTMMALLHAGNALYEQDPEAYTSIRNNYSEQMNRDMRANNQYWEQYDHTVLAEAGEKMNDSYLKVNGQSDGTRSYGRMVDLLLAEWRKNKDN